LDGMFKTDEYSPADVFIFPSSSAAEERIANNLERKISFKFSTISYLDD